MEKEIAEKVQRFLELSDKFTKTENEVFSKEYCLNMSTTNVGYLQCVMGLSQQEAEPTRTEKLKQELVKKVKLSEEYDEFMSLRRLLTNYFFSLNNLTKE